MENEQRIVEAKLLARSELKIDEWQRFGFHEKDLDRELGAAEENCERIHSRDVSEEEFVQQYELPCRPCIIEGLIDEWPARDWTFESLKKKFGGACLKCGEDDDGNKVKLSLEDFIRYMENQTDDAPMYVFDEFGDDALLEEGETDTKPLLDDYTVPKYFSEDLMQYIGEDSRPPFRWLLIGPKRSGSSVHIDPCCTSAWNSIIRGRKRWVLFPPSTPKHILKPAHWLQRPDRQAIDWFLHELPAIRAQLPANQQPLEAITGPGSTMFVPTNWWHAVLNLDDTLAVTQNFVSTANFPPVFTSFRTARAKLSRAWLRALDRASRADLIAAAAAIAGTTCAAAAGSVGAAAAAAAQQSRSQVAKRRKNGLAALHANSHRRSKSAAVARWRTWIAETRVAAAAAATAATASAAAAAAAAGEISVTQEISVTHARACENFDHAASPPQRPPAGAVMTAPVTPAAMRDEEGETARLGFKLKSTSVEAVTPAAAAAAAAAGGGGSPGAGKMSKWLRAR